MNWIIESHKRTDWIFRTLRDKKGKRIIIDKKVKPILWDSIYKAIKKTEFQTLYYPEDIAKLHDLTMKICDNRIYFTSWRKEDDRKIS